MSEEIYRTSNVMDAVRSVAVAMASVWLLEQPPKPTKTTIYIRESDITDDELGLIPQGHCITVQIKVTKDQSLGGRK